MLEELVTIATFTAPAEARVVKLLLEEQGFRVFLAEPTLARTRWFRSRSPSGATLQVLASQAEQAQRCVVEIREHGRRQNLDENQPGVTFACEKCNRWLSFPGHRRGGVEVCRYCQAYVDVPE